MEETDLRTSELQEISHPPVMEHISAFSPSGSAAFEQCPKKWYFKYVAKLPDPKGEDAVLGTFTHSVLELLLQEPADNRTKAKAKAIAREIWPEVENDPDFIALSLSDVQALEFRKRSWTAIEGLWELEHPQGVEVASTELEVKVELSSIPFYGFIDRVEREDGGLVITDYKSGKAPNKRFEDDRLQQVLLYAAALEQLDGHRPKRAKLLFLNNRDKSNSQNRRVVEVEVTEKNLTQATKKFKRNWEELNAACTSGTFHAKPQILCKWCSFLQNCPQGQEWVSPSR